MTLRDMKVGQEATVEKIIRGTNAERRLFEIGIVPGARVTLLSRHPFKGPLVVKVGNTQVAIGRGVASAVEVKPD
ncbi:MAG: FeoA family protein [Syntrophomonadaceae bacterium]|jgi:ferrous iron transport protein A